MINKRKIACITGTRADYPRVRSVLKEISSRDNLELYIIVTGSHLLQEYGYSAQEIIDDGFVISKKNFVYPTVLSALLLAFLSSNF